MGETVFYAPQCSGSVACAAEYLKQAGFVFSPVPTKTVTHLLLGIPAALPDKILEELSPDVTVVGGKLPKLPGYKTLDFLDDPVFVAENGDITARCAIALASQKLPVTWKKLPVLVIGWGRIGKCLARLLRAQDAEVTVVVRRPEAQAMAKALGYRAVAKPENLNTYRVVFNTADGVGVETIPYRLNIDLATEQGLLGKNVVWARGLPGKLAPESAGQLMAETLLSLLNERSRL